MPEELKRSQFTFYSSFFDAVKDLPDKMFVQTVKAICEYALNGVEIDIDPIPKAIFTVIKPNLDNSRRKAENGKRGGTVKQTESKTEANCNQEQTASKKEKEIENKREKEKEIENNMLISPPNPPPPGGGEKKPSKKDADFEVFWSAYPRKVGKLDAKRAFGKVKVPVETLVSAIEQQKCSDQWTRDNGQFIPHPATWLSQGRWEDELPVKPGSASGASYDMSAQMDRMRKWLEEGNI